MKLAGIGDVVSVSDVSNANKEILHYGEDPNIAVIIVTENIGEAHRSLLNKLMQNPWPVIVEIPGPEGKISTDNSSLKNLVKRALGIEIDI